MGNLEHNIKEAFAGHDGKIKLGNKDEMWSRLDGRLHASKGVAALWRVAAIFLGILLTAGVFAGINQQVQKQAEIEKLLLENERLLGAVDSLKRSKIVKTPNVQIVEKEKIIYKDKLIYKEVSSTGIWKKKYGELADSATMLKTDLNSFKKEITKLQEELVRVNKELIVYKDASVPPKNENGESPFELKSERIQLNVSKTPSAKETDMEMKILQRNFIENRNNLNRTLFNR